MINKEDRNIIAFIESNTTGTGHLFLKQAKDLGFQILFFCASSEKYPFLMEELVQPVIIDTGNEIDLYTYLENVPKLSAIFSSSEYFIEIVSRLAKRFNLPGNDPNIVNLCRSKDVLVKKLQNENINCPRSFMVNMNDTTHLNMSNEIEFPLIVKPATGSGSLGVKLCMDEAEYFEHINNLYNKNINMLVVQEYIEGEEFSVETISLDGKVIFSGITKKHLSNIPFFVEIGHDYPAKISKELNLAISEFVCNALNKIGFTFGPAHTEIRIKNNKPYVIEINPRLAGGMIPQMIKYATGIDLIEMTIKLFSSNLVSIASSSREYAAIRFFIPPCSGTIESINIYHEPGNEIVDIKLTKQIGESVALCDDFRDRIGYAIVHSNNYFDCVARADEIICKSTIEMCASQPNHGHKKYETGRLSDALSAKVRGLISPKYSPDLLTEDLVKLAEIDEAHLLMLYRAGYLNKDTICQLLKRIDELKSCHFEEIRHLDAPRGFYFLYENALIDSVGIDIAGQIHLGRSRNDINATIFKLKLRERYFKVYKALWQLRSELVSLASFHMDTPLPIYSQYQTALPGTLAHYLLGIASALVRDQQALQSLQLDIDMSPLGAGAGGGTTVCIDPVMTANLLGFSGAVNNSLDGVASRDLALRFLSSLSIAAMTLSRLVEDLQLWSTNEFKHIEFPDSLCGGSSMMPQKKNPYLLEKIKGRLSHLLGDFVTATMAMQKVPFGNSVEVGTEAINSLFNITDKFVDTLALLGIVIKSIKLSNPPVVNNFANNLTMSTYFVETLVKVGRFNFRDAHCKIGKVIRDALDNDDDPFEQILKLMLGISVETVPLNVALQMDYGGGPGRHSVDRQYAFAIEQLNDDGVWYHAWSTRLEHARSEKNVCIAELLKDLMSVGESV